jgi:hypothetical protein
MPFLMRILTAATLLALAACASQGPAPRPISSASNPGAVSTTSTATEAAKTVQASRESGPPPAASPAVKTIQMDATRRLEAVDVFVDMRDQNSMRQLVPYILQNEEWMLVKSEYITPTTRHYRFQRIASASETIPLTDPRRTVKPR